MIDTNNLQYCFNSEDLCPTMFIDSHIGYDSEDGQGIDGQVFMKELMYLDSLNKENINIIINSPGGVITDGMSIYHSIRAAKTPITTTCIFAASISAVIFQSGDVRKIEEYGLMMIHDPSGGDDKSLKNFKEAILVMIARSGVSEEKISKLMTSESWFNGNNKEYLGIFWDEVIETEKKIATKDIKARYKELQLITNSIKNNLKTNMNVEIKKILNVAENASDTEVISAINSIKNKVKSDEDKMAEFEDKMEDLKCKMEDLAKKMDEDKKAKNETDEDKKAKLENEDKKNEADYKSKCEKLEAKCEELEAKLKAKNEVDPDEEEEEEDKKNKKAENFLMDSIKLGKIVNEDNVKNYWKTQLKNDFEGTKVIINSFNTNTKGVDVTEKVTKTPSTNNVESLVAARLREINTTNLKKYDVK